MKRTTRRWMLDLALALAASALGAGCAHTAAARSGQTAQTAQTVISVQGIHCERCGAAEVQELKKAPGVLGARFDRDRAEVTVRYDPRKTTPAELAKVATFGDFKGVAGPGHGRYAPDRFPIGEDVRWLAPHGEAIALRRHLAPGKVTVFDFYAPWCVPCHKLDAAMAKILAGQRDVALRKLNIVEWGTPLANRYLAHVRGLPYVVVFGPNGNKVQAVTGLHPDALKAAIAQARGDAHR